jgi:hypothetical protein
MKTFLELHYLGPQNNLLILMEEIYQICGAESQVSHLGNLLDNSVSTIVSISTLLSIHFKKIKDQLSNSEELENIAKQLFTRNKVSSKYLDNFTYLLFCLHYNIPPVRMAVLLLHCDVLETVRILASIKKLEWKPEPSHKEYKFTQQVIDSRYIDNYINYWRIDENVSDNFQINTIQEQYAIKWNNPKFNQIGKNERSDPDMDGVQVYDPFYDPDFDSRYSCDYEIVCDEQALDEGDVCCYDGTCHLCAWCPDKDCLGSNKPIKQQQVNRDIFADSLGLTLGRETDFNIYDCGSPCSYISLQKVYTKSEDIYDNNSEDFIRTIEKIISFYGQIFESERDKLPNLSAQALLSATELKSE